MLFGASTPLEAALGRAGYTTGTPACLLVNAEAAPDLGAIAARCFAFADALPAGTEGLIITIIHPPSRGLGQWQVGATAAGLLSFTRNAALAWATQRIRVNMVEVHADVPDEDLAAGLLAIVNLASMTGQTLTLGAP